MLYNQIFNVRHIGVWSYLQRCVFGVRWGQKVGQRVGHAARELATSGQNASSPSVQSVSAHI